MKVKTVHELREIYDSDPREAEEEVYRVYENINRYEKILRAYITLRSIESVLEDVKRSLRERKILSGILVAVKDNISTAGIRTTCASKILESYYPPYDATIVERVKNAGGVVIGKTNLDEFAMGSTTETSYFGITRNPWDPDRVPGGSSGGSAVAVSAYLAHIALGTDTGGSIRNPASFTGIAGLKPTYGYVSRYGIIAYASSLDQAGPMARDVLDIAIMIDVISGLDPMDMTSVDHGVKSFRERVERVDPGYLDRKRVVMIRELWEGAEREVVKIVSHYMDKLSSEGLEIVEKSLPEASYALPAYYVIATAEASSNLARYQGILYGLMSDVENRHWTEYMSKIRSTGFGREVKKRIILGSHVLSVGYYEQYYVKALKIRRILRDKIGEMLRDAIAIVSPTTPFTAPRIGDINRDPMIMYLADLETVIANLIGGPAISIPAGFVRDLPIGVQFTSTPGRDLEILMLARASELKTGLHNLKPHMIS